MNLHRNNGFLLSRLGASPHDLRGGSAQGVVQRRGCSFFYSQLFLWIFFLELLPLANSCPSNQLLSSCLLTTVTSLSSAARLNVQLVAVHELSESSKATCPCSSPL